MSLPATWLETLPTHDHLTHVGHRIHPPPAFPPEHLEECFVSGKESCYVPRLHGIHRVTHRRQTFKHVTCHEESDPAR